MRDRLFGIIGFFGLVVFCVSVTAGQDQTIRAAAGDKYLISARAGGVNYIEGDVGIVREFGKSGRLLKGDVIEVGDRVSTGANGRAEILLNPGSYLRLAENSAFEFQTTDLENLQLKVDRGSAILEVYAANDFTVSLRSPKDDFRLIRTGVYRLDVGADGNGRLEVWKGRAEAGDSVLKSGRAAVSSEGDAVVVEKFSRDDKDAFETWSKFRSKDLAKETGQLKDRELRKTLVNSFYSGRWNMYDSFGLWVFNPRSSRYCFLPFGFGWSSPYGYGFGTDIWWYRLPQYVYYPPTGGGTVVGTPRSDPRKGDGQADVPPGDRRPRPPVKMDRSLDRRPPFAEMQGGSATGPRIVRGLERSEPDGGFTSRPIFNPGPATSAPMKSEPASSPPPTRGVGPIPVKGRDN